MKINAIMATAKARLGSIWKYALVHKAISVTVAAILLGGGYYTYTNLAGHSSATSYVLSTVQQGTFISSVTGTGQVSASTELGIQPQVSGTITSIPVAQGQVVSAGDVLARLDPTTAQKTVRNAQLSLDSANLALQQLEEAPTQLSVTQDQNAIVQAETTQQTDQANLTDDYQSAFNTVVGAFIDLPGIVNGLNTILNGTSNVVSNQNQSNIDAYNNLIAAYAPNAPQFESNALNSYSAALAAYDQNLQDYSNTSRYSSTSTISNLLDETYTTTKSVAEAVKDTKSFLDLVNTTLSNTSSSYSLKVPAVLATHEANAQAYTSTVNTDLSNLLAQQNTIKDATSALNADALNLTAANETLQKLQAGADPLAVKSQQLSIQNAQNSLTDAQQQLSYYTIRAPFDGVVASLPLIVGDQASSGSTIATIITKKGIAVISLNEVDAAKIQMNDKATLTFPALPDVTIAGVVSEIDTIGTVSQGVVTYNVQVAFDSQNTAVKPGMSVSAAIVTKVEPNVLLVPNSAIKTSGGSSYVQVLSSSQGTPAATSSQMVTSAIPPTMQPVQIGNSNNTQTVITSGLNAGDMVVTRTVASGADSAVYTQTSSPASGAKGGGGGFVGGGVRVLGL